MPSLVNLLRNTVFTLRYIPATQVVALLRHRLVSHCRLSGNPWPARIGHLMEKEWPATGLRSLNPAPAIGSAPQTDLFSRWQYFRKGKVVLLNREEIFAPGSIWEHSDSPGLPSLVAETLQYHQFLADFGELLSLPETREVPHTEILSSLSELLDEWWTRYPIGQLPAWGAFAVSFRIRSWLCLYQRLLQCQLIQARELVKTVEKRLFIHGLYLERNLERHLGGNHLFKDLCAMAMLASFFEGPTATRWFDLVQKDLLHEIHLQILPDGGHYERSTMYQCLVLTDLLDAGQFLMGWKPSWVRDNLLDPIRRMATFLAGTLHPDGEIPLFNDSVLGQSAPTGEILRRAAMISEMAFDQMSNTPHPTPSPQGEREGVGGEMASLSTFADAGFTCLHHGQLTCLFDHGRLGPDELMGHVHNDTLSLELSVGNERFIVDKGVYEYTAGPRRTECRSIRSHNTPSIERYEQAETWASFRVARRWHIQNTEAGRDSNGAFVAGEWSRPGMGRIRRRLTCRQDGILMIQDEIRCDQPGVCQIPFLFAPGIQVTVYDAEEEAGWCRWEAHSPIQTLYGWIYSPCLHKVSVEETVSWPRFYTELPSVRMVIRPEVQSHVVVNTFMAARWDVLSNLPGQSIDTKVNLHEQDR